jgi:nucleoside-diphosphate-sugar epimerase
VTGATGAVGPAVVERLCAEGYRVRTLTRGRLPLPREDRRVETCRGDVCDPEAVARAVDGVDWVLHAAALLHVTRPDAETLEDYERINVEGTRILAQASVRAGVSRLVLFGTIAVYGPTGLVAADESTPPRPDSPYAQSKLRAEEAVRALSGAGGLTTTVLRLAAVYGPRVKANYARLAHAIRAGWFVPVGRGRNRRTLVHEADVAAAVLTAARSPRAAGATYNLSDGTVHTLDEILSVLYRTNGRRRPRVYVPEGAARAAAKLADLALSWSGGSPRFCSLLEKYVEDVAVRGDLVQHELGFQPRFDLASGWQDALRSEVRPIASATARLRPGGPATAPGPGHEEEGPNPAWR